MIQARHLLIFLFAGLYGMHPALNNPQYNILKILLEQPNIPFTQDEKDLLRCIDIYKKKSSVIKLFYMKKDVDRIIHSKLKSSNQAMTQFLWAGQLKHFAHNNMLLNMNDAIQSDLTLQMLKKVNSCVQAVVIVGAVLVTAYHLRFVQEFEK